jgi:vanillate O-demethylase monooxygenase subunit
MVGWSSEIDAAPLARRILDLSVVVYRTESGVPAALVNRCPHRFAPLSLGKVEGDSIRCGYHGLAFDGSGRCSDSPFGLRVPEGAQVRSFPIIERHQCLWLWPGDPAAALPDAIPDFSYHEDPGFRVVRGYSQIKAHFELVTDNLMDLTHTRYLHPGFGGDIWVPEVSFSQEQETVLAHYELPAYPPTEFTEAFMSANGAEVFESDVIRWDAPASMLLTIKMGLASERNRVLAVQPSSHILCPETEESCHYFWASAAETDAPVSDDDHLEAVRFAFDEEDAPMLEAVQANMEGEDFWEMRPAILAYDNAGIRARRIMRQKARAEAAEAPAGVAEV